MQQISSTAAGIEVEVLGDALDDFLRAVRRTRGRFAAKTPPGELSISQYRLLDGLPASGEPMAVGEVAFNAGVSTPTATRMLTVLERDLLVERERAEHGDRRLVFIRLTDEGRALLCAKRKKLRAMRREMFAGLSETERRQAAQLLSRLAAAMEDYR